MTTKLMNAAIAAAVFASSSPAHAQQSAAPSKSQDDAAQRARVQTEKREAAAAGEAVGRATTTAATTLIETGQDVTRALDQPGKYNAVAISWNPLGLIVGGRVSLNVEWAPITHHVIIASPHFANPSQVVSSSPTIQYTNRFTGMGGELGYRYYTGHQGMNGIFVGPSLIGGVYEAALVGEQTRFSNLGVALDAGIQKVFVDHLALGVGAGIEYLFVTRNYGDLALGPSTIATTGLKPRLLAQAGYAF
jgi:Protein of unknown function (DUF3575)